jgi:PAS domain S-box-containing protein
LPQSSAARVFGHLRRTVHSYRDSQQIGASRTQASTALGASPFVEEALRWLPDDTPGDERVIRDMDVPTRTDAENEKHARILLADDNADMRDYVRRLLASLYEVEAVADGEAALAAIARGKPDLVLSDIMMQRLDDMQLLAKLRAAPQTRTMPVILLSARAGEENRVEGMQAGADDYLVKPFSARELLARIDSHIRMAALRRESERALRKSEEKLRRVLETDTVGVLFFDRDGTVIDANDSFLRMTGYARTDIERRELSWRRMTPPEWVKASEEQMQTLTSTGRIGPYEKEYFLANGSRRRQCVLDPVIELGHEQSLCLLRPLAICDVNAILGDSSIANVTAGKQHPAADTIGEGGMRLVNRRCSTHRLSLARWR